MSYQQRNNSIGGKQGNWPFHTNCLQCQQVDLFYEDCHSVDVTYQKEMSRP